ncbi:MAG: DUF512 domain-containing protein, partial [Armatimonadetes bacterium]|nr:DUF512 domain-containing protein [Armatimonadota bacterium]
MPQIKTILKGSISQKQGLKPGDFLEAINQKPILDILNYLWLTSNKIVNLTIKRHNKIKHFLIKHEPEEILGLEFDEVIFDKIKVCQNKCLFCFVDQLPMGLRSSLYLKDDDWRLSFLYGNFITLTNFTKFDWSRIKKLKISPLYISVHSTNGKIRYNLLKNPRASKIKEDLKRLCNLKINFHAQIVVCPGINDGKILDQTIKDLLAFYPNLLSIAVIPVGLSKIGEENLRINPITRSLAFKICKKIENYQKFFLKKFKRNLIFASDEFYVKAKLRIPSRNYYEDYPQIENGVGLIRNFIDEFNYFSKFFPEKVPERSFTIATSEAFYPYFKNILKKLRGILGLKINLLKVKNQFFGESIDVAGLITGSDLLNIKKIK